MRRIERLQDEMNGTVTYEVGDDRYLTLDQRAIQLYGLNDLLKAHGVKLPDASERVPVFQHGRNVGSLAGDFDPLLIKSKTFLYDVRPGDFKREKNRWIAADSLGPGDLEAIPSFMRASP